ncbi:MAG: SDR family NAD(P)-dependent oxidoreductase, partial [bacterium]|nr:SDR family NAD(P)-dependent oxidoreductase [bacterium]
LELSKYLAERMQARLVLIGRSELNADQKEKIKGIESKGSEVLYIQADATDLASMEAAKDKAKSKFGKINGVIHSAIVLRDMTIENMDEKTLCAALGPKIKGSVVLHQVMQDESLDFMMFFSSTQSFTGNAGQGNYAAACTFKDAYAGYLNHHGPYPVKIINWGYWGSVGIVSSDIYNKRMSAMGVKSITPKEGMEAIERVLSHDVEQVMVFKAEDSLLGLMGIDVNHQVELYPESISSLIKPVSYQVQSSQEETNIDIIKNTDKLPDLLNAFSELESFIQCLLLDTFQKMGVFLKEGERYDKETLRERLKIRTAYYRLYESLLTIFTKAGFIQINDHEIETSNKLEQEDLQKELADLENKRDKFIEKHSEIAPYIRLLMTCLNAYPELLTGKKGYMEVMFQEGSMDLVGDIYKGNEIIDYYNKLIAQIVEIYIQHRLNEASDATIQILEIGAGTGGTSGFVLDAIKEYGDQVCYFYTDISIGFTQYGEGVFGADYPFVQFKALDIERSYKEQGFEPNSIDLILASNVLHATKRIDNTLNRAKGLLKRNGLLIINEMTQIIDVVTLIFGLTGGWWLFEDKENRIEGSPLLSPVKWKQALSRNGYREVRFFSVPGIPEEASWQNVIIGESDGNAIIERVSVKERSHSKKLSKPSPLEKEKRVRPVSGEVSVIREDVSTAELQDKTESYIKTIFADVLKINKSELDSQATFEVYGVDSLIGMEIIKRFEQDFGDLSATLLFEHMTIELLTGYFIENYKEELNQRFGVERVPLAKKTQKVFDANSIFRRDSDNRTLPAGMHDPAEGLISQERISARDHYLSQDIAIIGVSGHYPKSATLDAYWENLKQGTNCISEIPKDRWNWELYKGL